MKNLKFLSYARLFAATVYDPRVWFTYINLGLMKKNYYK